MPDRDRFEAQLEHYLAHLDRRPLRPGAEQRVLRGLGSAGRPQGRHAAPLVRRTLVGVAVFAVVVVGSLIYSRQQRPPARVLLSELTVFAQPDSTGLDCSLAISTSSADQAKGFIVFAGGRATFHPVSGKGWVYVPAMSRWAETFPQLVAPDGRSYVVDRPSPTQHTEIHVVDSRGERTILKSDRFMGAAAFTSWGVLLMDHTGFPNPSGRQTLPLKLLDPVTGAVRAFPYAPPSLINTARSGSNSSVGYLRSGESLWLTSYDGDNDSASVARYKLSTGITTQYFDGQSDGHGHVEVVGADASGAPILQLSNQDLAHTDPAKRAGIHVKTLLLPAPHQATVLNQGRVGSAGVANGMSPLSVTDGESVWLGSDDGGIWLYQPGSGLRMMAKISTSTQGAPGVSISGPCR